MATQSEKVAKSLEILAELHGRGKTAIRSRDLTRTHRERLLAAGYLREVMKGWYIASRPDQNWGESASWYVAYWDFCADYLNSRLGDDWCLSPEQSLLLHAGNRTVPQQLIVRSSKGSNSLVPLPFGTSLLPVRASLPKISEVAEFDGLRIYSLAAALISVAPDFFNGFETDARAALSRIASASEVLPPLLEQGHTTIAGRLAGAFENIDRPRIADDIMKAMRAAGHQVRKHDPFTNKVSTSPLPASTPTYVRRLQIMWAEMRGPTISCFPPPPASPVDPAAYLKSVEEKYVTDAYHSLSIEGYRVSKELIERVKNGEWAPTDDDNDRDQRNAMAAKGYWRAFQRVKKSLERVLAGDTPGTVADEDHGDWYRELFAPAVTAGLLRPADLAGYRNGPVYIRNSRHVPPRKEAVRELMPTFFELLKTEDNPAARIVLGHFVLVYIHPYMDGNGRMGRFLMNLMMAAGGLPWVVIPVEQRLAYMASLEKASVEGDIVPFARFLATMTAGE